MARGGPRFSKGQGACWDTRLQELTYITFTDVNIMFYDMT